MNVPETQKETSVKRKPDGDVSSEDSESDSDDNIDLSVSKVNAGGSASSSRVAEAGDATEENETQELINVDFAFCDFRDNDFGMVKTLLLQGVYGGIDSIATNASSLADIISAQKAVGTTIRVGGEDEDSETVAFLTMISMECLAGKGKAVYKGLSDYVMEHCPSKSKDQLEKCMIGDHRGQTAWMINERLINMPHQVVPPLHRVVVDDIEWAQANAVDKTKTKTKATIEDKDKEKSCGDAGGYQYKYIGLLAPVYCGEAMVKYLSGSKTTEKGKERKRLRLIDLEDVGRKDLQDLVYLRYEEEMLAAKSLVRFLIPLELPQVMVDKAKGAVPQKNRPRHAVCIVCTMESYKNVVKSIQ